MLGEDGAQGTSIFHSPFESGLILRGGLASAVTPLAFGPRNWGQWAPPLPVSAWAASARQAAIPVCSRSLGVGLIVGRFISLASRNTDEALFTSKMASVNCAV